MKYSPLTIRLTSSLSQTDGSLWAGTAATKLGGLLCWPNNACLKEDICCCGCIWVELIVCLNDCVVVTAVCLTPGPEAETEGIVERDLDGRVIPATFPKLLMPRNPRKKLANLVLPHDKI